MIYCSVLIVLLFYPWMINISIKFHKIGRVHDLPKPEVQLGHLNSHPTQTYYYHAVPRQLVKQDDAFTEIMVCIQHWYKHMKFYHWFRGHLYRGMILTQDKRKTTLYFWSRCVPERDKSGTKWFLFTFVHYHLYYREC